MTLLEKAKELGHALHPSGNAATGCPWTLGLESRERSEEACRRNNCAECYAREYVEYKTKPAQEAKADAGKLELDLVPVQILRDIAQVRMYGNAKYGDPDNWKTVELRR